MAKSAKEHLESDKAPKTVVMEKDFAGIKKGQKMFVATPAIVADYISQIPYGETRTIERMRRELARKQKCDASCPVSTAIFMRIAAQAALEDMEKGRPVSSVIPFWRLIKAKDKVVKKLGIDPDWIESQRALEKTASQN